MRCFPSQQVTSEIKAIQADEGGVCGNEEWGLEWTPRPEHEDNAK